MKKIIVIALTFFAVKSFAENNNTLILASPTYTKVVKSNGGLFGYKYVNESSTSNGSGGQNQLLACSEPGRMKCQFTSAQRGALTQDDFDKIDILIEEAVRRTQQNKNEGQFVYNTEYLVVYNYHQGPDKLTYEVFTREEAKQAGYTF